MKVKQKSGSIFQLLPRLGLQSCDGAGMGLSGMCIIHCMFMPITLGALPFMPFLEAMHHWLHPLLTLVIVPITLLAMWRGFRKHQTPFVLLPLVLGLAIILVTNWLEDLYPLGETVVGVLGSGLLIFGHWWNRHAQQLS